MAMCTFLVAIFIISSFCTLQCYRSRPLKYAHAIHGAASATRGTQSKSRCFAQALGERNSADPHFSDFPERLDQVQINRSLGSRFSSSPKKVKYKRSSFIMKNQQSPEQSRNEFAAIKFFGIYFRIVGSGNVPSCCLYEGDGASLVCRWLSGRSIEDRRSRISSVMKPFFLVSVLAGHYDAGTKGNTVLFKGEPYFLDLGGCFFFSASGSSKSTHRCAIKNWQGCKHKTYDDRKCYSATYGGVPYQLFDFRNGIGKGGWDSLDTYWSRVTVADIEAQFKSKQITGLDIAVDFCCTHEDETQIRSVLAARWEHLKSYLSGDSWRDVMNSEQLNSSPANSDEYLEACQSMMPEELRSEA